MRNGRHKGPAHLSISLEMRLRPVALPLFSLRRWERISAGVMSASMGSCVSCGGGGGWVSRCSALEKARCGFVWASVAKVGSL